MARAPAPRLSRPDATGRTARPAATGSAATGSAATGSVAAVVVNYESGAHLARCVEGLSEAGVVEIVVVDNGSSDGSVAALDRGSTVPVRILDPGANLGYGSAANRGVAATSAPLVLVTNPDVEIVAPGVEVLAGVLDDDPGLGLVGPLIRRPDGDRYPSARRFPSPVEAAGHALLGLFAPRNRFTRAYQQDRLDRLDPTTRGAEPVDWVSGACFVVRREAFEAVGGFDETYFMYAEDVDLCWRLGRAGWGVGYVPSAEIVHGQGVSTARHPYRMIVEHHRSLVRFWLSTTTGWRRLLLPIVVAGASTRVVLATVRTLPGPGRSGQRPPQEPPPPSPPGATGRSPDTL